MNITIKEVPEELHSRIREAAEESGRSLNRHIIHVLEATFLPRKSSREDLLARIRRRRGRIGGYIDDEMLRQAIDEGRE